MSTIEWNLSNTFPLPYRVLIISVIGLWAWGSNLQILSWTSINVPLLLSSSHDKNRISHTSYKDVYTLAVIITSLIWLNLIIFWKVTGGIEAKITEWTSIPLACYAVVFAIILCPFNIFQRKERAKFLRCIRRVVFSGFGSEVLPADVIMADILTSFAKVFGDLYVTGCILLFYDVDQEGYSANRCWSYIIAPLFTRFRQCMTEYIRSKYSNRRHLFNAFKYCSAFPVILFSALQKWYKYESLTNPSVIWIAPPILFKLWVISVAFNSMYSFYWDVVMDWKLEFFSPTIPGVLMPSLKLRVFLMEIFEVIRRWLWIFFRMESAYVEEKFDKEGGDVYDYDPLTIHMTEIGGPLAVNEL
ncbi:6147_t:CDS:2 [Funneliformis geosporum]|uniref:6147_t:CDS:1 n=1 Tax=Funneliformis geosporum TaxID=1117311 RepID=A0A9W4SMH7_9GLOM|nr:6147_t:CDS:2 [Funneliformis geosporum]